MIELIKASKNPLQIVYILNRNGRKAGWIRKELQGGVKIGYLVNIYGANWPTKLGRSKIKGTNYKFLNTLPAAKNFVKDYFSHYEGEAR